MSSADRIENAPENHSHHANVATLLIAMALLLCLGLPALQRSRSHARVVGCAGNLSRIATAIHNYHSAYRKLPIGIGGTRGSGTPESGNDERLTGFAGLLPFMEQQALWHQLSRATPDSLWPAMGPAPDVDPGEYKLWAFQVETFLCPEETVKPSDYGLRSYVFCFGDGIDNVGNATDQEGRAVCRGMFMRNHQFGFRDCLDGLSNTIMVSETAIGIGDDLISGAVAKEVPGLENNPGAVLQLVDSKTPTQFNSETQLWREGKGSRWADGTFRISGFTTVIPPNGPSATMAGNPWGGVMAASSQHPDGVLVVMGDGAIRFVSDTVDTGNLAAPGISLANKNPGQQSPYGVWGALGSRGSRELIPPGDEVGFRSIADIVRAETSEKTENSEEEITQLKKRMDSVESKLNQVIELLQRRQ